MKRWCILLLILLGVSSQMEAQVEVTFPQKSDKEIAKIRKENAIDLNGLWEGEVSQLTWNGQPAFAGATGKLHVEIEHIGNTVKGLIACRAKFADNMGYLSYDKYFQGTWNGDVLIYEDERIENYINTHKTMRHLETCLKEATLSFYRTTGKFHLEGEWTGQGHVTGIDCVPGKIHLTKVNPEDLALEYAQTANLNFAEVKGRPAELKWDEGSRIKKIRGRKVEKGKVIEVKSKTLSITVYDHKKDDGDIISLNYNGFWLLEKFKIHNEKHKIDVVLDDAKKAKDYLLLYAHNLGRYPPNTVAVIVDDGVSQQRFILNSDMNVCDVIYFDLVN